MSRLNVFESSCPIADDFFKTAVNCASTSMETAICCLKQALFYNKDHWPAMFNLGIRMHSRGSLSCATKWFTRCITACPTHMVTYEYACLLNLKLGRLELAS